MSLVKILDGKFVVGFSNCGNSNGFDVTYIAKRVINGKYVVLLNETTLGGGGGSSGGSGGVGGFTGFDGGDLNGNNITGLSGGGGNAVGPNDGGFGGGNFGLGGGNEIVSIKFGDSFDSNISGGFDSSAGSGFNSNSGSGFSFADGDNFGLSGGEVGIGDGVNNGSGVGGFTGFDTGGVIIGGGGVNNFIDGVNSNINNTLGDADSYDDTNTNNDPCEGAAICPLGLVMYCVSSGEYYKIEAYGDGHNFNYIPISKDDARAILLNVLCSDYKVGVVTLDDINFFLKSINLDPVNDDDECYYI